MNKSKMDVRWQQRFANFTKALKQLTNAVELGKKRELAALEQQGLVQAFEYTYELAWKTIKDFYEVQGEVGVQGSRDAIRLAFARGLIEDGEKWMEMIKSRNQATQTYNEDVAQQIVSDVVSHYYDEFIALQMKLSDLEEK